MRVKFKNNWFAPKAEFQKDAKRTFSGQMFPAGEQIVPDELFDYIPKSAKVLEKPKGLDLPTPLPSRENTLAGYDNDRGAFETEAKIQNEQHDNMAKARAARKAKADKRKAS
jgi:hypothetical protein